MIDGLKFYLKILFYVIGFIWFLQFIDECDEIKTDHGLILVTLLTSLIIIIYGLVYKKNK